MLWNAAAGGGGDEQQCALQALSYALSPTLDASNVTGGRERYWAIITQMSECKW